MNLKKYLLIILFVFILSISFVSAKSYSISGAEINMTINDDGSVLFEEYIAYSFVGDFSFAYRDINLDNEVISDIEVFEIIEPGISQKVILNKSKEYKKLNFDKQGNKITWYYTAHNERKVFLFRYKLTNVLEKYNDITDFYWKIWGSGWDNQVKELKGNLILPNKVNDSKDVYTWGHPELNGKIAMLDNDRVIYQIFDIPRNQWVELRVVFPSDILVGDSAVEIKSGNGLNKIIKQENNYVDPDKRGASFIYLIPIFMIVLFLFLYFMYGREPEVNYHQIYEREIPYEYSPAIVTALINQTNKKPAARDFVAVILNLCLKGHLQLEVVSKKKILGLFGKDKDYKINFTNKNDSDLSEHENDILYKLREINNSELTFSDIKNYARKDKFSFNIFFKSWQKQVEKEAKAMNFYSKNQAYKIYNILSMVMFISGYVIIRAFLEKNMSSSFYFGFIIAGGAGLLINNIFNQALARRTEKGALHYKKWIALKKFLKDMSAMKEHPPESIVIWEKFLVYGLSLGVADKVSKAMQLVIPNGEYSGSRIFVTGTIINASILSGFASDLNSFSSEFATASGTSGSGGFGGGGGAGGGGGGGGAG